MKYKSDKLRKLEKERFSVFTDDLDHCYFCSKSRNDLHELLNGRNRINSMKWGFILPLCRKHHTELHNDVKQSVEWKRKCQKYFESKYSYDLWMDIFKRNYK